MHTYIYLFSVNVKREQYFNTRMIFMYEKILQEICILFFSRFVFPKWQSPRKALVEYTCSQIVQRFSINTNPRSEVLVFSSPRTLGYLHRLTDGFGSLWIRLAMSAIYTHRNRTLLFHFERRHMYVCLYVNVCMCDVKTKNNSVVGLTQYHLAYWTCIRAYVENAYARTTLH